jgi:hypothetical protein
MKALWKLLPAALLAAGAVAAAPAAAVASASPSYTIYPDTSMVNAYKISSATMIDDAGGRQANGNTIQMWSHGTKANEMWNIHWLTSALFEMQLTANPAYCLDLTGGSLKSGTKVQLWKCSLPAAVNDNQLWFQDYGTGTLPEIFPEKALLAGGKKPSVALDANGGKNGARLEIKKYSSDSSQFFRFCPVDDAGICDPPPPK